MNKQPAQLPQQKKPSEIWFVLGREPNISAAEIAASLNLEPKNLEVENKILRLVSDNVSPDIINELGGTVKIGERLFSGKQISSKEDIIGLISDYLSDDKTRKKDFGLSLYRPSSIEGAGTPDWLNDLGKKIKKRLADKNLSSRYIFDAETELSSVSVVKNDLLDKGIEFLILEKSGHDYSVAKTLSVQPFEKFSERDFNRPGRDDFSGMLPPKLAMMMINLSQTPKDKTLLDPFCGSGTVLSEALLLGYQSVIGSDLYDKAVTDSEKNIAWLKDNSEISQKFSARVFQADVHDLEKKINKNSIGGIVTEPYLGIAWRGKIDRQKLDLQLNELKELYLAAFRSFSRVLELNASVVFLIPRFWVKGQWVTIDIKKPIMKMGFEVKQMFNNQDFLLYHRPGQQVGREIWRFRYSRKTA